MSNGIKRNIKLALIWGASSLLVLEMVFCFYANTVLQSFDVFAYDGAEDVVLTKDGKIFSAWSDGPGSPAHSQKFEECTSQHIDPPLTFLFPTISKFGMDYGYAFSKWGAVKISFNRSTNNVANISFWGMDFGVYPNQISDAFNGSQHQCSILRMADDESANATTTVANYHAPPNVFLVEDCQQSKCAKIGLTNEAFVYAMSNEIASLKLNCIDNLDPSLRSRNWTLQSANGKVYPRKIAMDNHGQECGSFLMPTPQAQDACQFVMNETPGGAPVGQECTRKCELNDRSFCTFANASPPSNKELRSK